MDFSSIFPEFLGQKKYPATADTAMPAVISNRTLRRRADGLAALGAGARSIPAVVTSKAHAKINAMGKPIKTQMITRRRLHPGNDHAGKIVADI